MHDGQLDIDSAAVRRLVAAQFPAWREFEVVPVPGSGTVNAIFRIGPDLAARFPLTETDAASTVTLQAEASAIDAFAAACPVAAPRHVAFGSPGEGYPLPWAVQTWIEGDVATPDGLAGSDAFACDLAGVVAALRSVSTGGRSFAGRGRGGVLKTHDAYAKDCVARCTPWFEPVELARVWSALRDVARHGADVMSHGDLIPANLLVADGRLTGILDGGGFAPADPALDLVAAWHLLDAGPRAAVRERLAPDIDEWLRGAGWALLQALGLVWYYERTNPVMALLGRSTLTRVLGDPEVRALAQVR